MKGSPPRVSIIIPAYHSAGTVERSLHALRKQTLQSFEIVVVNSSPEDRTQRLVTAGFPEVVFEQSPTRLLPHAARNRGVSLARGDLLVFTDPDCQARPDWLMHLIAAYDAGHPVVGGSMGLASDRWLERGIHICKFWWLLPGLPPGPRWIMPTANACYSREVWTAVGPFDGDRFAGDALLSWRAAAAGYSPWFEPKAVVEHRHEESLASLWRQRVARGREFAEARTEFERWSRLRAATFVALLPLLVPLVLCRAGRSAFRSGWGWRYLLTLPVQFIGQAGWCLGEAKAHWRHAASAPSIFRNHRQVPR